MNQEKTVALVLKRTHYGEADRVVQLITPLGRRHVIARGVRKERSKLAGGIELLAESDVVMRQGKGQLAVLVSARMRQSYAAILADYDRLMFAYESLRVVARGSDQVDASQWYDVARATLAALADMKIPLALVKAWFFIQVAELGGYGLSVWRDTAGHKITAEQTYRYDVNERGLQPAAAGQLTVEHIKIFRLLSTQELSRVATIGGMQPYLAEVAVVAHQHAAIE